MTCLLSVKIKLIENLVHLVEEIIIHVREVENVM
jgi:hypothetical protein